MLPRSGVSIVETYTRRILIGCASTVYWATVSSIASAFKAGGVECFIGGVSLPPEAVLIGPATVYINRTFTCTFHIDGYPPVPETSSERDVTLDAVWSLVQLSLGADALEFFDADGRGMWERLRSLGESATIRELAALSEADLRCGNAHAEARLSALVSLSLRERSASHARQSNGGSRVRPGLRWKSSRPSSGTSSSCQTQSKSPRATTRES
jgi:hypothetical protein